MLNLVHANFITEEMVTQAGHTLYSTLKEGNSTAPNVMLSSLPRKLRVALLDNIDSRRLVSSAVLA